MQDATRVLDKRAFDKRAFRKRAAILRNIDIDMADEAENADETGALENKIFCPVCGSAEDARRAFSKSAFESIKDMYLCNSCGKYSQVTSYEIGFEKYYICLEAKIESMPDFIIETHNCDIMNMITVKLKDFKDVFSSEILEAEFESKAAFEAALKNTAEFTVLAIESKFRAFEKTKRRLANANTKGDVDCKSEGSREQ